MYKLELMSIDGQVIGTRYIDPAIVRTQLSRVYRIDDQQIDHALAVINDGGLYELTRFAETDNAQILEWSGRLSYFVPGNGKPVIFQ